MKKRIATLLVIAMGISVLAGCGNKTEDNTGNIETGSSQTESQEAEPQEPVSNDQIELTFMGWGNDSEVPTFQAMIDAYEEKYGEI